MTQEPITEPTEPVQNSQLRMAFYIDGFNLYHALDELDINENYCKWLNLYKLAEYFGSKHNACLKKVVFCTASPKHKGPSVIERHERYIKALEYSGVCVKSGWFLPTEKECKAQYCNNKWNEYSEKEGDVNLAVSLVEDAYNDVYDIAFLLTSDSDQRPSIESVNKIPKKQVVMTYPNWRKETRASSNLANECNKGYKHINKNSEPITIAIVKQCLFQAIVPDKLGRSNFYPVRRPREYDPPQ